MLVVLGWWIALISLCVLSGLTMVLTGIAVMVVSRVWRLINKESMTPGPTNEEWGSAIVAGWVGIPAGSILWILLGVLT